MNAFDGLLDHRELPASMPGGDSCPEQQASACLAWALFNNAPIASLIVDASARIARVNRAFTNLFGYTNDEIKGRLVESISHPDDVAATRARAGEIASGRLPLMSFEKKYLHRSGRVIEAHVTVTSMSVGGEWFMLGQIIDQTDLRGLRSELALRDERLEMAADNTGLGVWDADLTTLAMTWDANLRRLYELDASDEDPTIQEWLGRIHPEDQPAVQARVESCLAPWGTDTFDVEFRVRLRDGSDRWLRSKGRLSRDSNGRAMRGVGINIDLTESKLMGFERIRHAEQVERMLGRTVEAITTALEIRDPYTAGHERKVAKLAIAIGREMGIDENRLQGLKLAAELHDIGKLGIPSEILTKPTRLTEVEYSLIKTHAQAGYDILKNIEFPWPVAEIIYQHHEQVDGTGYPRGLKGDAILLEAKILAVADTVEAMSAHRPYRPMLGTAKALDEIARKRGISYDADAVDACIRLFRDRGYTIESA